MRSRYSSQSIFYPLCFSIRTEHQGRKVLCFTLICKQWPLAQIPDDAAACALQRSCDSAPAAGSSAVLYLATLDIFASYTTFGNSQGIVEVAVRSVSA
eukprot:6210355-Pleurochrysis_carterae.AAC.4